MFIEFLYLYVLKKSIVIKYSPQIYPPKNVHLDVICSKWQISFWPIKQLDDGQSVSTADHCL